MHVARPPARCEDPKPVEYDGLLKADNVMQANRAANLQSQVDDLEEGRKTVEHQLSSQRSHITQMRCRNKIFSFLHQELAATVRSVADVQQVCTHSQPISNPQMCQPVSTSYLGWSRASLVPYKYAADDKCNFILLHVYDMTTLHRYICFSCQYQPLDFGDALYACFPDPP